MSSKIINSVPEFVDTVLQLYPPFREWDKDQERTWSDIMTRELDGFSPAALDRAFTELVRSRKGKSSQDRSTPSPGECAAFCQEAKRWIELEENKGKLPISSDPKDEFSTERWRLAHQLKRTPLGQQAAREGWIVAFVFFVLRNQRVPAGREIDQCRRDSEGIEEVYGRAMRGEIGPPNAPKLARVAFSEAIAKLAGSMLEKRRKWAEEALGQ